MPGITPDSLKEGGYQFRFDHNPLVSQTQLFMLGKEHRNTPVYRLDGRTRPEKNHFLLQYTLSGCGLLRLADQTRRVPPGTAMLLHFPDDNEYRTDPESAHWEFVYIMVQGHALEPVWMDAIQALGPLPRFRRGDPLLQLLYRQIAQAQEGGIRDPFEASRVAYDFTMALARAAAGTAPDAYPPPVIQALAVMNSRYASLRGMDELASILHLSKAHMIRIFKRATGLPPGRYLLHIRMRQAAALLQNPSLTLDGVARMVGYDNGNYFSKVFAEYFHARPSEFRRNPMNAYAHITF